MTSVISFIYLPNFIVNKKVRPNLASLILFPNKLQLIIYIKVNRKVGQNLGFLVSFQIGIYFLALYNIGLIMELKSIIQDLQILEKYRIINKVQRIGYIDLLIYIGNFEEVIIRNKDLRELLNQSQRNVKRIIQFFSNIGLIKRKLVTDKTEDRNYGNCSALQLIDPEPFRQKSDFEYFQSLANKTEKKNKTYIGKFNQILSPKGIPKYVAIYDIYDLEGNLISPTEFIDYVAIEPELIKILEKGNRLQFEGIYKKGAEGKAFIDHITNIINVTL